VTVLRGPTGVRDPRAIARDEVVAQVPVVDGPHQRFALGFRIARLDHLGIGLFADVKTFMRVSPLAA
jgi:hypothetical protein